MTDYNVKLDNQHDLELFANFIKRALEGRMGVSEHFSSIRLSGAPLRYNDFMHPSYHGFAEGSGAMEVRQATNAISFAGVIIHEMGHVLVGTQQSHNSNWRDGCAALGLLSAEEHKTNFTPEDFDPATLKIINEAIEKFAREHPTLVYDPHVDIPLPEWIGHWDCVLREQDNGCAKHRLHTMKFQEDGVREMLARSGNILLADDMGLGKTPQTMMYINVTKPKRVLVGCPNNAKLIWRRHFQDWCTQAYDVEVAYTSLYQFSDVVIMNYEAMVRWADILKKEQWDLVVYDEGHYLKTPNAKRSRVAYAIHGTKAIIITGSPIVNYPYEVFPLIHYLDRANWPEYGRFEAMFGSRSSDRLGRNLNRLNSMLRATVMTRRLKKDVLTELPRKRRQIVEFETTPDIKALIEQEKKIFEGLHGNTEAQIHLLNAIRNESDVAADALHRRTSRPARSRSGRQCAPPDDRAEIIDPSSADSRRAQHRSQIENTLRVRSALRRTHQVRFREGSGRSGRMGDAEERGLAR